MKLSFCLLAVCLLLCISSTNALFKASEYNLTSWNDTHVYEYIETTKGQENQIALIMCYVVWGIHPRTFTHIYAVNQTLQSLQHHHFEDKVNITVTTLDCATFAKMNPLFDVDYWPAYLLLQAGSLKGKLAPTTRLNFKDLEDPNAVWNYRTILNFVYDTLTSKCNLQLSREEFDKHLFPLDKVPQYEPSHHNLVQNDLSAFRIIGGLALAYFVYQLIAMMRAASRA